MIHYLSVVFALLTAWNFYGLMSNIHLSLCSEELKFSPNNIFQTNISHQILISDPAGDTAQDIENSTVARTWNWLHELDFD